MEALAKINVHRCFVIFYQGKSVTQRITLKRNCEILRQQGKTRFNVQVLQVNVYRPAIANYDFHTNVYIYIYTRGDPELRRLLL